MSFILCPSAAGDAGGDDGGDNSLSLSGGGIRGGGEFGGDGAAVMTSGVETCSEEPEPRVPAFDKAV
jgi:hypothetical protein